jgi:hypothetical protein
MDTAELYGLCVRSDVPLPGSAAAGRRPDVELVRAAPGEAAPFEPGPDSCVYRNADGPAADNGVMEVHRRGAWYAVRCTGYVDFYFTDGDRVRYAPAAGVPPEVIVVLFVGPVCAVLLELRGRPCLHASAVRFGRAAVALAGNSGAGKSTLAAALVGGGRPLVGDDVLPLAVRDGECLVTPGPPQMKLTDGGPGPAGPWPPVVPGSDKRAVPVGQGWGELVTDPTPLAAVYVLERDAAPAGDVRVEPLTPAAGLVELVRFSFCARLVERLGLQPGRLALLAGVARHVRVCRLRYASGPEHLARVEAAIADDLNTAR